MLDSNEGRLTATQREEWELARQFTLTWLNGADQPLLRLFSVFTTSHEGEELLSLRLLMEMSTRLGISQLTAPQCPLI